MRLNTRARGIEAFNRKKRNVEQRGGSVLKSWMGIEKVVEQQVVE